MEFVLAGKAEELFRRIREMKKIAEAGGDIIYEGYRKDGDSYIYKIEITAEGKYIDHVFDPAPSQALYNHSPDGFEWGYSGSGPAQLALAIIMDATGNKVTALKYHQEFKEKFVSTWRNDYFHINASQVRAWIQLKQNYELVKETFVDAGE
jgi:hypothetical protein